MNKLAQYLNKHLSGEVLVDISARTHFSTDGSPLAITPQMVVYPRSTNDIRKLMRFCWQLAEKGHTISVTARGAGTDRTGGAIGSGAILSTAAHLDAIFEYDDKQRLVRLQPGVSVAALQDALGLNSLVVSVLSDVPRNVTVGGVVTAGQTSRHYSDWIDQLEVVLANGDVLQTKRLSKRELHKKKGLTTFEGDIYRGIDTLIEENKELVSQLDERASLGYSGLHDVKHKDGSFDLTPLFVGTQGTLGIVSEMILRAETAPQATVAVTGAFAAATNARDVLEQTAKLGPAKVEYFAKPFIQKAQESGKVYGFLAGNSENDTEVLLVVTFTEGSERHQAKKAKKLCKLYEQAGAVTSVIDANGRADIESLAILSMQSTDKGSASVPSVDGVYVPLERFEAFLEGLTQLEVDHRTPLPLYGLPLEGLWYVRPSLNLKTAGGKAEVLKLINDYAKLVEDCSGTFCSVYGEGRLQTFRAYQSLEPAERELFENVKKLFDPQGVLNNGVKQPLDVKQVASLMREDYISPHRDRLPRY